MEAKKEEPIRQEENQDPGSKGKREFSGTEAVTRGDARWEWTGLSMGSSWRRVQQEFVLKVGDRRCRTGPFLPM